MKFPGVPGWILFTVLAAMGWAGCSKAGLSNINPTRSSTYVVLMNMAPFAPSAEIYLNDIKSTSPVAPGNYSISYEHLEAGTYHVKFKIAGSDSVLAQLPSSLYDTSLFYTLILYNTDTVHKAKQAIKIADDFTGVTGSYAYFRFIDMCPDLPSVDFYINGQRIQHGRSSADITSTGGQYTSFQPLAPQSVTMEVTKTDSTSKIAHLDKAQFQAGNAYTILLSGSASNPSFPIDLHILNASY